MPSTFHHSVAYVRFSRSLKVGAHAWLFDIEGQAVIRAGRDGEWRIEEIQLEDNSSPMTGSKVNWGHSALDDSPLGKALGDALRDELMGDPDWCSLAADAIHIATLMDGPVYPTRNGQRVWR